MATTCSDLGDGAVDQNGVSVDLWAPGIRIACGFGGYENGDDPMPAGTPFDAPRPFRFDSAYDHNEVVYGFKIFYYQGDPATHCGDVRQILHQGGGVAGFDTEFHTYQIAVAQCDAPQNGVWNRATMRIMDVGGQADLGCLIPRQDFNATGEVCPPGSTHVGDDGERITADMVVCPPVSFRSDCMTVWYPTLRVNAPGLPDIGVEGTMEVDNPITLLNPADHAARVLTAGQPGGGTFANSPGGYDGTARGQSLLLIFQLNNSGPNLRWNSVWDSGLHRNVVAAAGTPGSWPMRIDHGFNDTASNFNGFAGGASCFGNVDQGNCTQRHPSRLSVGATFPN